MKQHRTDGVSLVFGLLFAAVTAWWLLAGPDHLDDTAGWLGIAALAIIGVVGVLSTVFKRPAAEVTEPEVTEPEVTEPEVSAPEPEPAEVSEP